MEAMTGDLHSGARESNHDSRRFFVVFCVLVLINAMTLILLVPVFATSIAASGGELPKAAQMVVHLSATAVSLQVVCVVLTGSLCALAFPLFDWLTRINRRIACALAWAPGVALAFIAYALYSAVTRI